MASEFIAFSEKFPVCEDRERFRVRLTDGRELDAHYEHGYLYLLDEPHPRRPNHDKNERLSHWSK